MSDKRTELQRRYDESLALLRRCRDALLREAWQDGETSSTVVDAVMGFLTMEELEEELVDTQPTPVPFVLSPVTNRWLPDLTDREHICKWQRPIRPAMTSEERDVANKLEQARQDVKKTAKAERAGD